MTQYVSKLKECYIVSEGCNAIKRKYAKHTDIRYNLKRLNERLNNGKINFLELSDGGEILVKNDYCLLLEDEEDNIAQLILAASESEILEALVICADIKSAEYVLSHVSKTPLFIGLDFRLSTASSWHIETNQIYLKLKKKWNDVPVIGITNHESESLEDIQNLVSTLRKKGDSVYNKSNIWDALPNIFRDKFLISKLNIENKKVRAENKKLKSSFEKLQKKALGKDISKRTESKDFDELKRKIIGGSVKIKEIRFHIEVASKSNQNILILGETGTGKELVARAIHALSGTNGEFEPINCAAIPLELLESELFGHEKGAFTGAREQHKGKFELAKDGTIFLDELHLMSLDAQAKLLRAIDEKVFRRIGGEENICIENTRILAAVKPNVEELINNGSLIEDLFGRLNSFMPPIPTLKERKEDIPELVEFFLDDISSDLIISKKAIEILQGQEWKRNVRELKNFIINLNNLYSFIRITNIEEDQINYALSLHNKTGGDAKIVQKMIGYGQDEIAKIFNKSEEKKAKDLFSAIIVAIEKYPSKKTVKLTEIATKITMPGTKKTGVTPQHLSTMFNLYKKYFKNLMNSDEFLDKLSVVMKYRILEKILTS